MIMCRVGTTLIRVACHVTPHNNNMLPSLPLGLKDYKRELKSLHNYFSKSKMPTEVLLPLGYTPEQRGCVQKFSYAFDVHHIHYNPQVAKQLSAHLAQRLTDLKQQTNQRGS